MSLSSIGFATTSSKTLIAGNWIDIIHLREGLVFLKWKRGTAYRALITVLLLNYSPDTRSAKTLSSDFMPCFIMLLLVMSIRR